METGFCCCGGCSADWSFSREEAEEVFFFVELAADFLDFLFEEVLRLLELFFAAFCESLLCCAFLLLLWLDLAFFDGAMAHLFSVCVFSVVVYISFPLQGFV